MSNEILDLLTAHPIPFGAHLGIEVTEASPQKVVGKLTVTKALCTIPDILHGGAVMSLADQLGAIATTLNLPQGAGTTTLESKTNFLRAVPLGDTATGTCEAIHIGRRTMVWRTEITKDDGKLCAVITQTQMVLEPKS